LGIGGLIIDLCPPSEDLTLYRDLFNASSSRLLNLIEDSVAIINIDKTVSLSEALMSFTTLFEDVQVSLEDIQISIDQPAVLSSASIKGDGNLLKRALKTVILLATSFSKDKHAAHIAIVIEEDKLCVRLNMDDFHLTDEQAYGFFEISSSIRGSSAAEILGLSPVVAHKIICAFGGELRLLKGTGRNGSLEAVFIKKPDHINQERAAIRAEERLFF